MKKKIIKISVALFCVIVLCGCAAAGFLYYKGLLSFSHPLYFPGGNRISVACVGDSVTYGFGINNRVKYNYPKVLGDLLGDGYAVNNYGYSGRTACRLGDRPYVNEELYEHSIVFDPDIVVIMLGSNDSKDINWSGGATTDDGLDYAEAFKRDYSELLDTYLNLPSKPKVYVSLPIPAYDLNGKVKYGIQPDVISQQIMPIIRAIAEEKGLDIIDMYSVFDGKRELYSDGLHPTAEGAALLAETVYNAITADN